MVKEKGNIYLLLKIMGGGVTHDFLSTSNKEMAMPSLGQ